MEENGSTRTSSNSSNNNPVYRDLKLLQTGEVPQEYNPQSRTSYQQRGYSPGIDRQRNYEKEQLQPSPSSREEERKSSWDYEKNRKEYSRSRDYSNEYREFHSSVKKNLQTQNEMFTRHLFQYCRLQNKKYLILRRSFENSLNSHSTIIVIKFLFSKFFRVESYSKE